MSEQVCKTIIDLQNEVADELGDSRLFDMLKLRYLLCQADSLQITGNTATFYEIFGEASDLAELYAVEATRVAERVVDGVLERRKALRSAVTANDYLEAVSTMLAGPALEVV